MINKRSQNILMISVAVILVTVILCVVLTRSGKTDDETVVEETVPVENDDAVRGLYRALELVVSDPAADMDDVVTLLSGSADLGNSDAMYFLGELYFQGIGVEADLEKAGAYLRQACESGNRRAMPTYAKMLFLGDGVAQDYDESASWFYTLSDDDGEASYVLGVMSNLGMGVPRSAAQAKMYIDQAAAMGYGKAESYRDRIDDRIDGTDWMDDIAKGFSLQAKKTQEPDYGTAYEDLQGWIDAYHDRLRSTENYGAFEDEMTALLNVDIDGVRTVVLFGNNGYLFHQNENDGTPLHDYIGDNHFSKEELETIAADLVREKEWIEQNGSKFVLLLIPNKETMYPEWMPSYISRADETTRQDLLAAYLQENTDIEVVYVKDTLMQNRERYPLYYKTDTHANMVGSLFMVSDLLKACYGAEITPDLEKFDIHMQDYAGDLGTTAKCTARYVDTVYFYPEQAVEEADKIASSMMLVGDSFSEFLNMETAYYMKGGVDHRMIADYGYDYHSATEAGFAKASEKPEYVVWECVERHLDRLK